MGRENRWKNIKDTMDDGFDVLLCLACCVGLIVISPFFLVAWLLGKGKEFAMGRRNG